MSHVKISVEVDENKLRPVDVPIIEADTAKIRDAIGWHKKIKLEETIADTLNYWRLNI
jgi:GDP-4-dehydro-6-deoxy-D-mannose reductase